MLRVGLTGGLASGKSTVARLLADRGAAVFDADELVRERVRRWVERGGTEEDARRRIAAQMPAEEAASRAHEIIVNNGSAEDLRRQVEEIWGRWLALAGN